MQSETQGVPGVRLPDKTRSAEDSRMVTRALVAKRFQTDQAGIKLGNGSRREFRRPRLQGAS